MLDDMTSYTRTFLIGRLSGKNLKHILDSESLGAKGSIHDKHESVNANMEG